MQLLKHIYLLLMAGITLGFAMVASSCQGNDPEPEAGELIAFSMSDDSQAASASASAAVPTRAGFSAQTKIVMRIQSDGDGTAAQPTKYTRTVATAGTEQTADGGFKYSNVSFEGDNRRYWDDTYGRDAKLSVYAVAIANKNDLSLLQNNGEYILPDGLSGTETGKWGTNASNSISFSVETANPTPTTIANQDLVYSNNIQADATLGTKGRYVYNFTANKYIPDLNQNIGSGNDFDNGRMQFELNTGTDKGKFDRGHMHFQHALSRITVQIVEGEGFDTGNNNDFQWAANTNIAIAANTVGTSGTLDVKTGTWSNPTKAAVTKMAPMGTSFENGVYSGTFVDANGYYCAQVLPGYAFTDEDYNPVLSFNIDNNLHKISGDAIFEALKAGSLTSATGSITMMPGKNYSLKITVKKSGIGAVTATVLDWETVTAQEQELTNARVTLSFEDRGSNLSADVDVYRKAETADNITTDITSETGKGYVWNTGYGDKNLYDYDNTTKKLQTDWYWPDNKTFYHFRALGPTDQTITTAESVDYISLTAAESYTDVTWGAPFKDIDASAKITYSTTYGFDGTSNHQIYQAIGPTESTIKLLMFHMMSDVTFNVKTTTGTDAVSLGDGSDANCTKIELKSIYTGGKALMGNGLVSTTGSTTNYSFAAHPAPSSGVITWSNYGAIPQSLEDVVLVITTPDKNRYEVAMKDVKATATPSYNNVSYPTYTDNKINYWYPGVKYTYTFTLKKKAIESITATIVNWETVTAGDDDVQIQ